MIEPKVVPMKKASAPEGRRTWPLLGVLVLVTVLAAGAAIFLSGDSTRGPVQVSEDAGDSELARQVANPGKEPGSQAGGEAALGVPARGNEDAPVVMVEYADFQCPFCGQFTREVEPYLVEEYVESGILRIEWRDFPYRGQESINAALAARAAQEQGKFWEYHDLLYQNQGTPNSGAFTDEKLVALAEEAGLDVERLASDFTSGRYEGVVSRDLEEAASKGIPGTPTFFVNDKPLVGVQPVEAFEGAIEEALQEAGAEDA